MRIIFIRIAMLKKCTFLFSHSESSPYNFINLICTCLLLLKNKKFFQSIFLELILIKTDSLRDA